MYCEVLPWPVKQPYTSVQCAGSTVQVHALYLIRIQYGLRRIFSLPLELRLQGNVCLVGYSLWSTLYELLSEISCSLEQRSGAVIEHVFGDTGGCLPLNYTRENYFWYKFYRALNELKKQAIGRYNYYLSICLHFCTIHQRNRRTRFADYFQSQREIYEVFPKSV